MWTAHRGTCGGLIMDKELEKIAMLIDADNYSQIDKIEPAILEISKYGKISLKRAYGNWGKDTLKHWGDVLRNLAIKPVQQLDYVAGKNATDIALTIDAMDCLYNSDYDGYAILSGDSDFTPLAIKLKKSGKFVIGIGNRNTNIAFVSACDIFVYLETFEENSINTKTVKNDNSKQDKLLKETATELDRLLKIASDTYQNDEGFVNIGAAGAYIGRVKPDFNIKEYGVKKLPEYLRKMPQLYEVRTVKGKGKVTIIEYKIKE